MTKRWTLVWGLLAVGAISAMPASADPMKVKLNTGPYSAGQPGGVIGGEFVATPYNLGFTPVGLNGGTFSTFCLEYSEHFNPGNTYYAQISTGATRGGVSGGNPDPLDQRTARLYELFATQSLAGYSFAGTQAQRTASAGALQRVIWGIEGEFGGGWNSASLTGLEKTFYDQVGNWNGGLGSVRVLNLFSDARMTQYAQDQLVMAPVPAPAAALLGALGLGTVALVRRRFS